MKKAILTTLLIVLMYKPTYASIEGRIFLELQPDPNNKQYLSTPLNKLYQKNIYVQNIRGAFLNLKTQEQILLTDVGINKEYTLQKTDGRFDISELIKANLQAKRNVLHMYINSPYCSEGCKAHEYPFVKILYSFNEKSEIHLLKPFDGQIFQNPGIFFQWEGIDTDGKFLEYRLEVGRDRFFTNDIIYESDWNTNKNLSHVFEPGIYFWRVRGRDNSFLENTNISATYGFEILAEESIDESNEILQDPIIFSPMNNWRTNAKVVELVAKTDTGTKNYILLNNLLIHTSDESDIQMDVDLREEGENEIKIISQKDKYSTEASVRIFTKWSPPSTPHFEFKVEDGKVFMRINNEDYDKAYIYFENDLILEIAKSDEWVEIGEDDDVEMKFGVMLEDDLGNQTDITYEMFSPHADVLGIGGSDHNLPKVKIPNAIHCRYRYNITHKKFTRSFCNIPKPTITKVTNTTTDYKTYHTTVHGTYNPYLVVIVDEYKCRSRFGCREKFVKRNRFNLTPYTAVNLHLNRKFTNVNEFRKEGDYAFTSHIIGNTNLQNQKATLYYHVSHGFKFENQWVDILATSRASKFRRIPREKKIEESNSQKIFEFPFKKNIGVTQWHGYTAYQSPHTGVDFGSYKEPIYAIGDGTIREAQWDNYAGQCLTGGYFLRIEHPNGMNSVYLHLENYKKSNGTNWTVGEKVTKGDLLGISGNTGAYNCQPLGYHLHFELRKDSYQKNHTNPIPYIKIDWNNIHTLQHTKYPGRLTGNNPHPTW